MEEELKYEIKAYVVPYDLPSENMLAFAKKDEDSDELAKQKAELREYIRAERVKATYYLHGLGVLATNSVVLVPTSKVKMIDAVIQKVDEIYRGVNKRLEEEGFTPIGYPIIKKIPIVQTQVISFKELAERQLKQRLDEKIDSIANLINKLQEGVEGGKAKSVKYSLNRTRRELENLEAIAKELGIDVSEKFALLAEMINQAIETLGGR